MEGGRNFCFVFSLLGFFGRSRDSKQPLLAQTPTNCTNNGGYLGEEECDEEECGEEEFGQEECDEEEFGEEECDEGEFGHEECGEEEVDWGCECLGSCRAVFYSCFRVKTRFFILVFPSENKRFYRMVLPFWSSFFWSF